MTEQEQRIALCEWAGWKPEVRRAEIPEADFVHEETFWTKGEATCRGPWLPDTNSLDVLHEFEKRLNEKQEVFYLMRLMDVMKEDHTIGWKIERTYHATAAQRREALLRTLGLWKEDK